MESKKGVGHCGFEAFVLDWMQLNENNVQITEQVRLRGCGTFEALQGLT